MKKLRVYLDTSVFGGVFDQEFSDFSSQLFENFKSNRFIPIISDLTIAELENAPEKVKNLLDQLNDFELVEANSEMINLAKLYIKSNIVTQKYSDDALHIAIATILKADVLVSWNFKHIVNLQKIHQFNDVNISKSYSLLEIRTPREVMNNEN